MAQHDYNLANQTFPSMRTDKNNALSAVVSNNSGAAAPSTTFSYMWWADETADVMKQRKSGNDGWVTLWPLDNEGGPFRRHTADPNGAVPAEFVGQPCLDTTTNTLYIATTAGNAATAVWTTEYLPVQGGGGAGGKRNVILGGKVNTTTKLPEVVGEGTGRVPELLGLATPLVLTFAAGLDPDAGQLDYTGVWDVNDNFPTVTANSTGYLYVERNSSTGVLTTGFQTYAPIYSVDEPTNSGGASALLHFEGADTSTTMTDAVSTNTWTVGGNAQIDTAQFKFGASSLLLDGTGDHIITSSIGPNHASAGEAWCMEGWFRWNSLTGDQYVMASNTQGGVSLHRTTGAGGTLKIFLSTNGSTLNIANDVAGSKNSWNAGQWYHIAITWDQSTYRVFVDGVQDISISSSSAIHAGQGMRIGGHWATSGSFNGWVDEFRLTLNSAVYTSGFTPPATAFVPFSGHWYSINEGKMYYGNSVTGWTQKQVVYVGECVTDASDITSVTSYAFNGRAFVEQTTLATGTKYSKNHNMGTTNVKLAPYLENKTTEGGFAVADRLWNLPQNGGSGLSVAVTGKNSMAFTVGGTNLGSVAKESDGTAQTLTAANWKAGCIVERSF